MLELYGFSKVNAGARGHTRDLRVLWAYPKVASYRDRCLRRPAWKRTFEAYCERVEAG